MGSIGGLLGTAGGQSGTGISGPNGNQIQSPVTSDQLQGSQAGANQSLASQKALLDALLGNNAVGNQNNILGEGGGLYNVLSNLNGSGAIRAAAQGQGQLVNQLAGAGGISDQTAAAKGLQSVAAQQQAIANGQGPNPAQAMLNQATGQNVANQAALMAGQRGAGANVGLIARQAAQQGAATQQQAAGQAATMQSQQQLNALNALAGTNQALAGVGSGLTGQQQAAVGQLAQIGQGTVELQQSQLGTNAGIAQNQVQNLAGVVNQNVQGNLTNAGQALGAQGQANTTNAGIQENVNSANAGLANTTMQGQQGLVGGVLNAAGAGIGSSGSAGSSGKAGARGGVVKMADGGVTPPSVPAPNPNAPQSSFGQFLTGFTQSPWDMGGNPGANALNKGMTNFGTGIGSAFNSWLNPPAVAASANQVPMASAENSATPPQSATGSYLGGNTSTADYLGGGARGGLAKGGGSVQAKKPSQKAVRTGNSYDNDRIPAMLSEGEVVIPRSVMQSSDPVRGAADFVAKVMAKRGRK